MSLRNELKDLALEGLALLIMAAVCLALFIYTDLGKWPVILIGTAIAIGVVYLIRRRRKE